MPSRNKKINRDFHIEGRRAVLEILKNPSRIEKLVVSNVEKIGPQIELIVSKAKSLNIPIDFVSKNQLDRISHTKKHQGVLVLATSLGYYPEKNFWEDLKENNKILLSKFVKNNCIDLIFNLIHGTGGEDGLIQSYLDELEIKYVGSKTKASEVSFNKIKTKNIWINNGLTTPDFIILDYDYNIILDYYY